MAIAEGRRALVTGGALDVDGGAHLGFMPGA